MSEKLVASSKRNPCDLCGDETGKCRITRKYLDYEWKKNFVVGWVDAIQCMTTDTPMDTVVGDWVSTGKTKNDQWCKYLHLTNELIQWRQRRDDYNRSNYVLSDEEIKRREERQRQREEQKRQQQEERKLRSLSADDRHRWYSQILKELPESRSLLEDYDKRGFSDLERVRSGFRSVTQWQRLTAPVDPRLPGASKDGLSLIVSGDGYLCPIPDPDGRILGCQLRLSDPGDTGRYRYLSSSHATLPLFPPGENPIAFFRPSSGKPSTIALVEGVGAKAVLTSERFNAIVIGAPGGLWLASPTMFRAYLSRALAEVGGDASLIIFPDAGDSGNRQVVKRWKKVAEFLSEEGWSFDFGWWGQIDKNHPDADELTQEERTKIDYISGSEFFTICEIGVKNSERRKASEEKAAEKEQIFQRCKLIRKKLTTVVDTAEVTVTVPTLEKVLPGLVADGAVNIVISPTGTGKTQGSKPLIADSDACSCWHNRLSLAQSSAREYEITFKNEKAGNLSRVKKIAACSPSQISYNPSHLRTRGVMVIDECDQVLDFSFSDICNRDGIRPLVLGAIENQIEAAITGGMVLAMSADVGQKEINYLRSLAPDGTPIRIIRNNYRPTRGVVYVDTSSTPDAIIGEIIDRLRAGERIFLLDDLKNGYRGVKSIAAYIRNIMPEIADKVIEVHADNTDDPNVQALRSNANEESRHYRLIACSPSIISGISITNGLFTKGVFIVAQGILTDRSVKQFANRIRGAEEIYCWIAEEGFPLSSIPSDALDPEEIKAFYHVNYDTNAKHIMGFRPDYNPLTDEWESPHFTLYCQNLAYHNATMQFLRRFTLEHLEEEGYTVVEIEFTPESGTQEIEDDLKYTWGKIEIDEALAINDARFLSDTEMDALAYEESIPSALKPAYEKTRLRNYFGEELIQATTFEHKGTHQTLHGYAAMALKNADGRYAQALDNFWLYSQDIGESVLRDYTSEWRQMKHGSRFPGDIRWNTRKRKCREWLQLKNFFIPEHWWEPVQYWEVAKKAKTRPLDIKRTFNYNVDDVGETQVFTELMSRIGLTLKAQSIKGSRHKLKAITQESWDHCQLYVKHRLAQKESENASELVQPMDQLSINDEHFITAYSHPAPIQLSIEDAHLLNGLETTGWSQDDEDRLELLLESLPICEDDEMLDLILQGIPDYVVTRALACVGAEVRSHLTAISPNFNAYQGTKTLVATG